MKITEYEEGRLHAEGRRDPWRGMVLWIILLTAPACVHGADPRPAEAEWAAVLSKDRVDGEMLWLEPPDDRALALLRAPILQTSKGAVILLPPMGTHPDWPAVISPLRTRLPDYGWTTLSIQLPALGADVGIGDYVALFPAAQARIGAAVDVLQKRGVRNIVLIGYGLGALMGAEFLAEKAGAGVSALITVSMISYPDLDPRLNGAELLAKVSVPVLDVYAARDLDIVLDFNAARARAARLAAAAAAESTDAAKDPDSTRAQPEPHGTPDRIAYAQLGLTGTDHSYSGQEAQLAKRLAGWMKNHARAAEKNGHDQPGN